MARRDYAGRFRLAAAMIGVAALPGCAQKVLAPAHTPLPVYQTDMLGGAKVCTAANPSLIPGKTVEVAMAVTNDGGWCAITVHQAGPEPYSAGLLTARPAHGKVLVHSVGDDTRIDYTPASGFVGTDSFSVRLLPNNPTMRVAVTVARGPRTEAPKPEPAKTATKTKAKRK